MAYSAGQTTVPCADKKFLDLVITDLISLSYECKRKYPPVKEVCNFTNLSVTLKVDVNSENCPKLTSLVSKMSDHTHIKSLLS